jgi:hypothetical protein
MKTRDLQVALKLYQGTHHTPHGFLSCTLPRGVPNHVVFNKNKNYLHCALEHSNTLSLTINACIANKLNAKVEVFLEQGL